MGPDSPSEAPRRLAHSPGEGAVLENPKNGDQKTTAAPSARADVQPKTGSMHGSNRSEKRRPKTIAARAARADTQ
jgi:hypothetical protein